MKKLHWVEEVNLEHVDVEENGMMALMRLMIYLVCGLLLAMHDVVDVYYNKNDKYFIYLYMYI